VFFDIDDSVTVLLVVVFVLVPAAITIAATA
jgi:hypothetical protein